MRRIGWIGATAFWTLFGLLSGIQVWLSMIAHGHSLARIMVCYVLVWVPWIVFTRLIVHLAGRHPLPALASPGSLLGHVGLAMAISILHSSWWMALMVTLRPFDRMTGGLSRQSLISFVIAQVPAELVIYAVVLLSLELAEMVRRDRQREMESVELRNSLATARLEALTMQIQPHFLFNALNATSSLVRSGKQNEAVVMIAGLSELLRYTLDHTVDQTVTVEEETGMLQRYLEIQRARFRDRLTFSIEVMAEARRGTLPTFVLQPLAENAIRHGIATSAAPGQIAVRAFRENGSLRIEMFNSGSLRSEREGIGLRNTRERLLRMYGDAQRFDLRDRGDGVLASLSIPWREAA